MLRRAPKPRMNPRVKKAAILIVKVAILAGILEYARRQSQTTDEIALPAADSAAGAVLAGRGALSGQPPHQDFVLAGIDGREVRVAPGARLAVVERRHGSPAAGAIYRARNADG